MLLPPSLLKQEHFSSRYSPGSTGIARRNQGTLIPGRREFGNLRLDYQGTTTDGWHANLAIQTPGKGSFNVAQILVPLEERIPQRAIRRALILSAGTSRLVRLVIGGWCAF